MMINLILNIWYIPVRLSFFKENSSIFANNFSFYSILFNVSPMIIFIIDPFIALRTSFYSRGILIKESQIILKNYINNYFFLDFLTLFPYFFIFVFEAKYLEIFFILRIYKIKIILREIEDSIQISDKNQYIIELLKLFILILYAAHICSCCFHFIADLEINKGSNKTWLNFHNLINSPWHIKYINSIYFSMLMMITVGIYTTESNVEKLFLTFFIILMAGVFAFSINTIGGILNDMNKNYNDLK